MLLMDYHKQKLPHQRFKVLHIRGVTPHQRGESTQSAGMRERLTDSPAACASKISLESHHHTKCEADALPGGQVVLQSRAVQSQ